MKKVIAFICLFATLLPLCACSSDLPAEEAQTQTREEPKTVKATETQEEDPLPTSEIVYPDTFSVGYNRQDISPQVLPIPTFSTYGYEGKSIHDPIQLTCTALWDGKTAFLLISVDLQSMGAAFIKQSRKYIEETVGIPPERVMINATHTHSAPDPGKMGQGNMKAWQLLYYRKLKLAVSLAMRDLTPAEAYIGTANTDGVTFCRRYLMDDGTYMTNPEYKTGKPVAYESEADTQLRTIRFVREGKKDVVMANYQTHYHGTFKTEVSADWVHVIREYVEKEMDVHFVYHSGASANLNFISSLGGRKYKTLKDASTHIGETVVKATQNEEKATLSTIQYETNTYAGKSIKGSKKNVNLAAMTCGDIGFAAAPYEMFDTNGQEIRKDSPCKMTFVCSLTNGSLGYIPSALAVPHGAYEVKKTQFAHGSGEEFAQELVRLLKVCKEKG